MKLILTKLETQHMLLYATVTLLAQKQECLITMVIVQIQAPLMNAKPREKITISVKIVKHVFPRVRIPLFFYSACKISYCWYWH